MVRTGFLIFVMVVITLAACDGKRKSLFKSEHLFFTSGEPFLHPSYTLLEFTTVIGDKNDMAHYSIGPLHLLSHCGSVRCGVYEPALSAHVYPVLPLDVLEVENDKVHVYSAEIEHQSGDTLILELSFSGVVEDDDLLEMVDGAIRVPVVKSYGNIYRCIVDEKTLVSDDAGSNANQRFFVNLNSLFM